LGQSQSGLGEQGKEEEKGEKRTFSPGGHAIRKTGFGSDNPASNKNNFAIPWSSGTFSVRIPRGSYTACRQGETVFIFSYP